MAKKENTKQFIFFYSNNMKSEYNFKFSLFSVK